MAPIGFGMSIVRQIAHIVDGLVCYIGYLWPLWDAKRQTFADKIMTTVCVPLNPQPLPPGAAPHAYYAADHCSLRREGIGRTEGQRKALTPVSASPMTS